MNNLNYNVYMLDENLEDHESILQFDNHANYLQNTRDINQTHNQHSPSHIVIPWRPTKKLNNLHQSFQQTILNQFPCLPCSNCSYLLYPDKAKWIPYKDDVLYPFKMAFPRSKLAFHPRSPTRIAICPACKNKPERIFPPYLYPIPPEIQEIPLVKRKYLSPIYLHSSLGRTPGVNPFSEYRSIVGTMNYSKNIRSFTLYSGMLGAFLEPTENSNADNRWFHPTLIDGSNWLKRNNPYLKSYSIQLENSEQPLNPPFPIRGLQLQPGTRKPGPGPDPDPGPGPANFFSNSPGPGPGWQNFMLNKPGPGPGLKCQPGFSLILAKFMFRPELS